MKKIHYHSECAFFAGCENMLAVLFNSEVLNKKYKISFSFLHSDEYADGYAKRVHSPAAIHPFYFFDFSNVSKLPLWIPLIVRRILMKLARIIVYGPLFIYEVIVLRRLFQKIKPDILHLNNGGYPAALSVRAAAIAGKLASVPKIVMVVNNLAVDYNSFSRFIDYPVDRIVANSVHLFITGSKVAAKQLQSVLSLPDQKITSIYNGIPDRPGKEDVSETRSRLGLDRFEGVIFGVVALLVPRKGHQVLLEAILRISKQGNSNPNQFKILIEGHGPLQDELITFVNKNGLNEYIEFVGVEENIKDFMKLLDVLVLPSVAYEDFPNVILEAMALGKPVISTKLAGIPEQIDHGKTGLLVTKRSTDELAKAMLELNHKASLRTKMGRAALSKFKKNFSEEIAIKKYVDIYGSIIEEKAI